jgi:hypothetical protein
LVGSSALSGLCSRDKIRLRCHLHRALAGRALLRVTGSAEEQAAKHVRGEHDDPIGAQGQVDHLSCLSSPASASSCLSGGLKRARCHAENNFGHQERTRWRAQRHGKDGSRRIRIAARGPSRAASTSRCCASCVRARVLAALPQRPRPRPAHRATSSATPRAASITLMQSSNE